MRIHGKILRLVLVAVCAGLLTGCSGINTGATVSPASFFLPGLMKADPPADRDLKVLPEPVAVVAQVR